MKLIALNLAELPFNARRLINQAKAISAILDADGRRFCQEVSALHESGNLDKLFSELEEANEARVLACALSKTHELITGEALIDINGLADHLDGVMRYDEDDFDLSPATTGKPLPTPPPAGGLLASSPEGASTAATSTPPNDPVNATGEGQTVPLITPTLQGPSGDVVISDAAGQSAGAETAASDAPQESAQAPEAAAAEAPVEAASSPKPPKGNKLPKK